MRFLQVPRSHNYRQDPSIELYYEMSADDLNCSAFRYQVPKSSTQNCKLPDIDPIAALFALQR